MGIFIRQDENRSKLQERLAAELRERAMKQAGGSEPIDQTKDSSYVKNTEQTSKYAWIGLVAAAAIIVGAVIYFTFR